MRDNPSLSLSSHDVHLWHASLAISLEQEKELLMILSPDEVQRANRFRFPVHRKHFIASRGILRCLLSAYLQIKPEELVFAYGAKGKPYFSEFDLQFNVSHSDDYAVYAFTLNHEIGVDIEEIEASYDDGVARRFFSPEEYEQLHALSQDDRVQGFYRIWARKEAMIKAIGEGLGFSLSSFTVPVAHSIKEPRVKFAGKTDWHLQSFEVDARFTAAFATRQSVGRVIERGWTYCHPSLVRDLLSLANKSNQDKI